MGAGNVGRVVLGWSPYLPDLPFRVAVQMALTAHDDHDPPCYWHGWAPLAVAAGKAFTEACGLPRSGCRGCTGCAAARKTVERAVRALVKVGLVEQLEAPRLGWNAKYALRFNAPRDEGERVNRGRGADKLRPFAKGSGDVSRTTLNVVQAHDAERRADARRSASEMHDAERRAEEKELHQQENQEENTAKRSASPAPVDNDRRPCGRCKWLPAYGHAPACPGQGAA